MILFAVIYWLNGHNFDTALAIAVACQSVFSIVYITYGILREK